MTGRAFLTDDSRWEKRWEKERDSEGESATIPPQEELLKEHHGNT